MNTSIERLNRTILQSGLILFGLSTFPLGTSAAVYRTVDENGNVIFSDTPTKEAEKIIVEPPASLGSPDLSGQNGSYNNKASIEKTDFKYRKLQITSPANGMGIRANNGDFELRFIIEPQPPNGHTVQLLMDGNVYANAGHSGITRLQNVDRGTHVFQLRVINSRDNKVLKSSPKSSVSVLR